MHLHDRAEGCLGDLGHGLDGGDGDLGVLTFVELANVRSMTWVYLGQFRFENRWHEITTMAFPAHGTEMRLSHGAPPS